MTEPEEFEDMLGYGARSLGYRELKGREQLQVSLLVHVEIAELSQHGIRGLNRSPASEQVLW